MSQQLSLSIQLRDDATFVNFTAADNAALLEQLQRGLVDPDEQFFYCWGNEGVGKSHLLQACCHAADQLGLSAVYIPLELTSELSPEMLEGLEHCDIICIDNISQVAGDADWEEALFHLYNRIREQQHTLIVTGNQSPTQLPIQLADLRSRLAWGLVYQVRPLSDADKLATLTARAKQRGFHMSQEVAEFLLKRVARDMKSLFTILDQLDQASLQQQRPITIPFVKSVLGV